MTILYADYILTCDDDFNILQNQAIAFDKNIKEIGDFELLKKNYPNAKIIQTKPNSVVLPGLTNVHLHLEFSANKSTLKYGDFIQWLKSVIAHRNSLSLACEEECMDKELEGLLKSGTTTIGAISSFGADLASCVKSPINIIYFNEVLGSNPASVDVLYNDFLSRLELSQQHSSDSFTPAISVHSPYSTHPILAAKALGVAKKQDMFVSTHFMESFAEREWLDRGVGDFKSFFQSFLPNAKPMSDAISYLELFKDQKVFFTHATQANDKEIKMMNEMGSITHAPVSNRLLGCGVLDIDKVELLTLGTDGLSSNNSLNLWDEMRAALIMHGGKDLNTLAQTLLKATTSNAQNLLDKDIGSLKIGYNSDIITIGLPSKLQDLSDIALHTILHTKKADKVFIAGEQHI